MGTYDSTVFPASSSLHSEQTLQPKRHTTTPKRTFLMMGTYDSTMFWAQSVEKAKILSLSLQGREIVGAK